MIEEVSRNEMLSTIHYMTEHFPYRLAGSPCEAAASRYVTERLKQYGLEVENKEFYTYNSDPMYSKVTVLEPEMEIDSLPCAHIRATKPEGEIFELIYVGNGDYAAYKDIDVTGKMVLVEVSYAPPVPEKARIAYEMGAAGIMCMNWGNDEEVICRRGLKGVWGNPTEANFHCIPEIVGVGVTRGAGLKLKQLCLEGRKVEVKVTAIADRTWSIVHQPTAILHGNGSSDEFLLVCSHLDAWKPGVTCNATGNATTLEICRILSKHRQELDRDVYFVFWDGHEVAEAAGSTWFVDNNWDNLNKHCVCYMHIDSTGVKETELYEIKASEELLGFAKKNINDVLPELELRAMALKKIGDQSFMGIGVSSITQRKSFTKEYMEHAHGATLGWWNHTIEDGEDKCDPVALEEDTRATLKVLYDLATAKLLPYDFSDKISVFRANVQKVADKFGDHMDFTDLQDNLKTVEHQVNEIQAMKEGLSNEQAKLYNEFVKMVARQITNVTMTCADKYSQDSYTFIDNLTGGKLSEIRGKFSTAMSNIVQGISQKFTDARTAFSNGLNNIKNAVSGAVTWFFESGKRIVSTFANGIKSAFSSAVEAVKGGLQKIRNLLPFSDAKEGPLSTLTLSGQRTMTTYAHGLTLAGDAPAEAMNKSLQQVQGALDRKPEKKVDLGGGKKDKDESSDEGSSGKGKQVIIHKLLVPVDLKKIKDLQQLLALLQEVEDYAAANEDGEPGDDEDAAPAPA